MWRLRLGIFGFLIWRTERVIWRWLITVYDVTGEERMIRNPTDDVKG